PPASSSRTRLLGSALSRLASTQPAEPAPTMTKSTSAVASTCFPLWLFRGTTMAPNSCGDQRRPIARIGGARYAQGDVTPSSAGGYQAHECARRSRRSHDCAWDGAGGYAARLGPARAVVAWHAAVRSARPVFRAAG